MDIPDKRYPGGKTPSVELTVTVKSGPPAERMRRWARAVMKACGVSLRPVSVLICGDQRIRGLNRAFRGIDKPPDVLSFPSDDETFLGDLAIDVPYALRQAARRGHGLDREIQILLTHGILHLLGHDHETDDGTMFRLQAELMARVFGPGPDGVPLDEASEPVPARALPERDT